MKQKIAIILIGPQGSGKGTQAEFLQTKYHLVYIASGDLARYLSEQNTTLGLQAKALIDQGKLLTDKVINEGIVGMIQDHPSVDLLFDGYPRTIQQAEFLVDYLQNHNYQIISIHLQLDDKEALVRIMKRRVCSECKAVIYPKSNSNNKCPKCGGALVQRDDDTEENATHRLHVYHVETEPVINFLKINSKLISIDAKPAINIVSKSIGSALSAII